MIPYPAYKSTNLPWLTKIPEHWEALKIKYAFKERVEKGYPEEPLLAATQNHGVIPKSLYETRTVTAQKDLHLLKLVRIGDFVISLRSFQGGIEYAYYQGIISPAYTVMIPNSPKLNPQFFKYLAKSKAMIKLLQTCVTGIREGQNIDYETLKRNSIPIPSLVEQEQIVRYLDSMTAKINKLIRAKKKQIALLQEQRQAIINQAVTRGLDPNAEMKDSGIDWLGKIPKEWSVLPLKRVCRTNAGISSFIREYPDDTLVTFLPMERISANGEIDCSEKRELKEVKSGFTPFARNDVVVAKITPCFENGKGACLDILDTDIGFGTTELIVLRSEKNKAVPMFLYYVTKTSFFRKMGAEVMTGSAGQKRVPTEFIANFKCGIPEIDEQNKIVHYLTTKTQSIDMLIKKIEKEKEFISEYKNSLISSVVTGQIDVRNIPVEDVIPDDLIPEDDPTSEIEEEPTTSEESEE